MAEYSENSNNSIERIFKTLLGEYHVLKSRSMKRNQSSKESFTINENFRNQLKISSHVHTNIRKSQLILRKVGDSYNNTYINRNMRTIISTHKSKRYIDMDIYTRTHTCITRIPNAQYVIFTKIPTLYFLRYSINTIKVHLMLM